MIASFLSLLAFLSIPSVILVVNVNIKARHLAAEVIEAQLESVALGDADRDIRAAKCIDEADPHFLLRNG